MVVSNHLTHSPAVTRKIWPISSADEGATLAQYFACRLLSNRRYGDGILQVLLPVQYLMRI